MPKLTPQQAADKHAQRLKGSVELMRMGIDNVTVAPGVQAAAKSDKMRQNLIDAIDSGKWAARVAAVPLAEWKDRMKNIGIPRIPAGIDAANAKMVAFYADLFTHQDTLQQQVSAMPDLTLDDNIQRMITWVRGLSNFDRAT